MARGRELDPRRALVFVGYSGPYLLHLNPFSENPPDLDGRILYAADRGPENLDLIAERPGRVPYFEVSSLSRDETLTDHNPPVPTITVTRATIDRGTSVTVRATVTNPGDDPTVVAYLQIGNDIEARTLSTTAQRGDVFDTEWTVAPSAAAVAGATPLPERLGEVVVGFAAGATADAALAAPHHEDNYAYRVDGTTAEVLTPGRPMLKRFNKKGKPRLQRAGAVAVTRRRHLRRVVARASPFATSRARERVRRPPPTRRTPTGSPRARRSPAPGRSA